MTGEAVVGGLISAAVGIVLLIVWLGNPHSILLLVGALVLITGIGVVLVARVEQNLLDKKDQRTRQKYEPLVMELDQQIAVISRKRDKIRAGIDSLIERL